MHLRLGQAARHDAQDQTPRHLPRRCRLLAQSDRLQPDPHSKIDRGIAERPFAPPKASQLSEHISTATNLKERPKTSISRFFSGLLVLPTLATIADGVFAVSKGVSKDDALALQ